jgi:hypothetical protein
MVKKTRKITDIHHKTVMEFHDDLGAVVFIALKKGIAIDIVVSKLELLKVNLIFNYIHGLHAANTPPPPIIDESIDNNKGYG